ncbi:MAG: DMT family transporter [Actinomycetota bacterium]|nr:DMT family transporter [Actinomycetota bacterium]
MSALLVTPARVSGSLLVIAGVLWGTGGLAGALLQSTAGLAPVPVAAYRLLVGGVLATLVVACLGQLRHLRGRAALVRLVVSGVLLAEFQAAYQVAVARISVSLATLITIGCVPVFVALGSGIRERRWPVPRAAFAILGSLAGLALLSGAPAGVDGWRAFAGVVASLLAGAGFALLTLVTARPLAGQHAITCVGLLLGGVLLLPLGLTDGMSVPLSAPVLGLVIYLGAVPTAVAYGAYFLGLRHTHPTAAALATMLEPLTATVLAVVIAGERLEVAGVAGAVLIAGALVVAPR